MTQLAVGRGPEPALRKGRRKVKKKNKALG